MELRVKKSFWVVWAIFMIILVIITISSGREPQYKSLKKVRTLYTDAQVAMARQRTQEVGWAISAKNSYVSRADKWISYSDEYLQNLIPPPEIPRSADVHEDGCPIHGIEIKRYGVYPWKMDIDNHPWQIQCPVGGEWYPVNNFDPKNPGKQGDVVVGGEVVDKGWGWKKEEDGQKYWFIGYYAQWLWSNYIETALVDLSTAYLLTGDEKYAHKALVMLDKIADYYPRYDHNKQSRFGTELNPGNRPGRIFYSGWEPFILYDMAFAYDAVFETIDSDSALQKLTKKSADQIKINIEKNILEEGARSIYTMDGRVQGNIGQHHLALATIAVVLDNNNTEKYLDWVLNNSGYSDRWNGIKVALDKYIDRDGAPYESAPGYNFIWIGNFVKVADIFKARGIDIYAQEPKLKKMMDLPLQMVVLGNEFTPSIGDFSRVGPATRYAWDPEVYVPGFREYGDPDYAKVIYSKQNYSSMLFEEKPLQEMAWDAVQYNGTMFKRKSKNFGGYGLSILRSGDGELPETTAVTLYYGSGTAHKHYDNLDLGIYSRGMALTPDLGYPLYANAYDRGFHGFVAHTISHNTVLVNEERQHTKNAKGDLYHYNVFDNIKYVDVDSKNVYPPTTSSDPPSVYRRSVALVDITRTNSYIIDVFRVKGGWAHDYSLHGADGILTVDIDLSPVQKSGTLADQDIPFQSFYDDPILKDPSYKGSLVNYRGSGYGFLYDVRKGETTGNWLANWEISPAVNLKATFLTEAGMEVVLCRGNPPGHHGNPENLEYILLRNRGNKGKELESTFVTILEPYGFDSMIKDVSRLELKNVGNYNSEPVGVIIMSEEFTDYILNSITDNQVEFEEDINFSGSLGIYRATNDNKFLGMYLAGGKLLSKDGYAISTDGDYTGTVVSSDIKKNTIKLHSDSGNIPVNGALNGKTIIFEIDGKAEAYTISHVSSEGDEYIINFGDEVLDPAPSKGDRFTIPTQIAFEINEDGSYDINTTSDVIINMPVSDITSFKFKVSSGIWKNAYVEYGQVILKVDELEGGSTTLSRENLN